VARLARLAVADHAHLVLLRGHSGQPVFRDDVDRAAFLSALQHACHVERVALHAYSLLDDHVWLLCTPASAQAVGRAGRGERAGLAIIQSYQPDHPAIRAVELGDAAAFYDAELALRERFGSPPFGRLVKLTVALPDRDAAERTAGEMADRLRARASERGARVAVAGPAPAYIARRRDRWRFNVVLRGDDPASLLDGEVGAPWSVDVDPESLL